MAITDSASAPATPDLKPYVDTDRGEVLRVLIVGVAAGLIIPLLGLAISSWIITPVFCQANQSFGVCASGGVVAYHAAAIIVALVVVAIFANWNVFRPLPIVIAVTIAMWGFKKFVDPLAGSSWLEYYLFSMILTGLCYMLFFWLLRLRNFPLSILLTIAAVALVAWAVVAA